MDDLISRESALLCLTGVFPTDGKCDISKVVSKFSKRIKNLPTAEPKRGEWNRLDMDTFNCNKCGATFILNQGSEKMHFCPNCGKRMEVDT